MSHRLRVVSLAAALLLFTGGASLAGPPDPTKPISPSQRQAIPHPAFKYPDLVPVVVQFYCGWPDLKMALRVKNQGTAKTTVAFKTRVKVNGVVWVTYQDPPPNAPWSYQGPPTNPHTTNRELWPGQVEEFYIHGPGWASVFKDVFQIEVDYENKVWESNEDNNVATKGCGP